MEATTLTPSELGLLLLPLLAVLLLALCAGCRDLPSSYESTDSQTHSSVVVLKSPSSMGPPTPDTSYPPMVCCSALNQPDLLPISRSPGPSGGSHRLVSPRQDSESVNSVASYENQERACEDEDDDEDDNNEGYLVVLPDSEPATGTPARSAPGPSNPSFRDSAFSMESGEDYVNVIESEESADASLGGSQEYVNVSQELPPLAKTEPVTSRSQAEEEEEGLPDYENIQEFH